MGDGLSAFDKRRNEAIQLVKFACCQVNAFTDTNKGFPVCPLGRRSAVVLLFQTTSGSLLTAVADKGRLEGFGAALFFEVRTDKIAVFALTARIATFPGFAYILLFTCFYELALIV